MEPTDFASRVKARREELGLSQEALGKLVGISQPGIKKIESGGNTRHGLKLATALGVSLEYLENGNGDEGPPSQVVRDRAPWPLPAIPREKIEALAKEPAKLERLQGAIALALEQIERDMLVAGKPRSKPAPIASLDDVEDPFPMAPREKMPWEPGWKPTPAEDLPPAPLALRGGVVANVSAGSPPAANDPFEKVPELGDVRMAAGEGFENEHETQTGFVYFRRSFLRSVGADRGRGRVVYVTGDSMVPDLKDGWAVLVVPRDVASVRELVPNSIYAINFDGKMIVKAVAKDRMGRWVARSANGSYADIALEGDAPVRILGPVVWAGGLLREGDAGQWVRR